LIIIGIIVAVSNKNGISDSNNIKSIYERLSPQAKSLYFQQSDQLTKEVDPRLVELDRLTIGCFGSNKIMQMKNTDPNLGGQCCGVLKNADQYRVQLDVIKSFIEEHREHLGDNADLIPEDPYEVPVAHAQKLIRFDNEIILNSEQQAVYDKAVQMSHHGGPCCCKCWKWYVMSGLAKRLIVDNNVDAEFLAELWDISSSCGHDEDLNMHKHYKKPDSGALAGHGTSDNDMEVKVDMQTNPRSLETNSQNEIIFTLKDSDGKPLDLEISHERILHTIIISEDFSTFAHIHPEDLGAITDEMKKEAKYPVRFTFPKAGKYLIAIDFSSGGNDLSKQFFVNVKGEPAMNEFIPDFTKEIDID
ncbi:MAG: hypothetical protein AABY07_02705, partial [Nanoarchaeota archaeon]